MLKTPTGKLKARWKRRIMNHRCHKKVWDFGLVYESEIISRMSLDHDNGTEMKRVTSDITDISE